METTDLLDTLSEEVLRELENPYQSTTVIKPWEFLNPKDPEQGRVLYLPDFLSKSQADHYLLRLTDKVEWKRREILLYGKKVMQPRKVSFSNRNGHPYRYSGQTLESQQWIEELSELELLVRKSLYGDNHMKEQPFDSVQMNMYENGKDSISWHSDNEKLWGYMPEIASISLGAERVFQMRPYKQTSGAATHSWRLGHGSLLVMAGATQDTYKHQVPKDKSQDIRINLTFRRMRHVI